MVEVAAPPGWDLGPEIESPVNTPTVASSSVAAATISAAPLPTATLPAATNPLVANATVVPSQPTIPAQIVTPPSVTPSVAATVSLENGEWSLGFMAGVGSLGLLLAGAVSWGLWNWLRMEDPVAPLTPVAAAQTTAANNSDLPLPEKTEPPSPTNESTKVNEGTNAAAPAVEQQSTPLESKNSNDSIAATSAPSADQAASQVNPSAPPTIPPTVSPAIAPPAESAVAANPPAQPTPPQPGVLLLDPNVGEQKAAPGNPVIPPAGTVLQENSSGTGPLVAGAPPKATPEPAEDNVLPATVGGAANARGPVITAPTLEKNPFRNLDPNALEFVFPGIQYEGVALHRVVQELSLLSQTPIQLDLRALERVGVSVELPVTIRMESATLRQVLETLARPYQLDLLPRSHYWELTIDDAGTVAPQSRYKLDDLAIDPQQAAAELLEPLRRLVAPESWQVGDLEFKEGALVVRQSPAVHDQLIVWFEKTRITRGLPYCRFW